MATAAAGATVRAAAVEDKNNETENESKRDTARVREVRKSVHEKITEGYATRSRMSECSEK